MKEAWGRWGGADEIGAINGIGPDELVGAARLVREGLAISLAQPISSRMMLPEQRPGVMHFMSRDGGDYAARQPARGGFQFADDTIVMPMHVGTHLDALCHCWYDDTLYNGFAATEVTSRGARRCAIHKLPPIATRGVLLDFVALLGRTLPDGLSIGAEMIGRALAAASITLRPGDAVLLRTGWHERQQVAADVDFYAEPGIDVGAATMLAESGVCLIGADNFAVEVLPFPDGEIFPVHKRLVRDFGVTLLEGLVLDELARRSRSEFLLVVAPLPVEGATGSPVNPVALL